jgi:hypothetical protein
MFSYEMKILRVALKLNLLCGPDDESISVADTDPLSILKKTINQNHDISAAESYFILTT